MYRNRTLYQVHKHVLFSNGWDPETTITKNYMKIIEKGSGFDTNLMFGSEKLKDYENFDKIILDNGDYFYVEQFSFFGISLQRFDLGECYVKTEKLIEEDKNFFYMLGDCLDFEKFELITLSDDILKKVEEGKCKIIFNVSTEPYSIHPPEFFYYVNKFAERYNLTKDTFFVICGELLINNNNNYRFTIFNYLYFSEFVVFVNKMTPVYRDDIDALLKKLIETNRNIEFEKRFLCYQRRSHIHRKALFYEVQNNEILKNNTFISLWTTYEHGYDRGFAKLGYTFEETDVMNEFFDNNQVDFSFDGEDLKNNLGPVMDIDFHKKTFLSVVSESTVWNRVLFISEKTFKPMYCLQPFVVLSSPGLLKELKKRGYMTFDRWWDESYDEEPNIKNRIKMICNILLELSNKTDEELKNMLIEMEDVLVHNFKMLTDDSFAGYHEILNEISKKFN